MYTPVCVRVLKDSELTLDGHAYDVSEGGIQFELDRGLAPGTPIAVQLILPPEGDEGTGRSVFAMATVVWLAADPDEPGPARMAAVFNSFVRLGDRERLIKHLVRGRFARAA